MLDGMGKWEIGMGSGIHMDGGRSLEGRITSKDMCTSIVYRRDGYIVQTFHFFDAVVVPSLQVPLDSG